MVTQRRSSREQSLVWLGERALGALQWLQRWLFRCSPQFRLWKRPPGPSKPRGSLHREVTAQPPGSTDGQSASSSAYHWGRISASHRTARLWMRGSALELGLVATPLPRTSRHDAERTLAQVVLALADGATCLSDLAALRAQPAEFGEVASEARVWRIFNHAASVELRGIARARAGARARARAQPATRW